MVECNVTLISRTLKPIDFKGNSTLAKIASPRYYRTPPTLYQNKRLCQYHIPPCRRGEFSRLTLHDRSFILEPPQRTGTGRRTCEDFVRFINLNVLETGLTVDEDLLVCGVQGGFSMEYSGRAIKVGVVMYVGVVN